MPNGMRCLDPSIADRITSLSTMRNNEEIFETFGFSYNTLRKVPNGMPLRRSLADRIEARARKCFEADGFLNISACSHLVEYAGLAVLSVFRPGGGLLPFGVTLWCRPERKSVVEGNRVWDHVHTIV